ncbi:unnamed protein product, partial [Polarella glacialis]
MDSTVESVYYNGTEITQLVSGNLSNSSTSKTVSFVDGSGAYLVLTGRSPSSAGDSCATAGFQLACRRVDKSGVLSTTFEVTSGSAWDAYGSAESIDSLHQSGGGQWWDAPCQSVDTSFAHPDYPSLPKIWASGYQYASFRWNPDNVVACSFSMRSTVNSVFYGGRDITQWVTGDLSQSSVTKQLEFSLLSQATLVISGQDDDGSGDACVDGGFQISCSNGLASSSEWQVLGSEQAVDSSHQAGLGLGWSYSPCVSTSGTALTSDLTSSKIWANSAQPQKYVAFRWTPAEVLTCSFTASNVVDSVYYNGADITSTVSGDKSSWSSGKQVSFTRVRGASLVIAAHDTVAGADSCVTGSFQIRCSNGISSATDWEVYGSSSSIDSLHQMGGGLGWSSTPCRLSSFDVLPSAPWLPQIWASPDKYAAFRWKDQDYWELALKSEWDDSTFHHSAGLWSDSSTTPFGTGAAHANTLTEVFTSLEVTRVKLVMDEYSAIITMPKGMTGALQDRYSLQRLASARSSLLVVALTQFVPATTPSSMQDVPQGILSGPSPGWSSKSIVDAFGLLATDPVSPEQRYCGTGFDMQRPSGDMVGARIGTILGEFADCRSPEGVEGIGLETKSTYLGSGTIDRLGQKKFSRATVYVHNDNLQFLTCTFTMDSVFESLYYNGVNMTHLVSGDFISSSSTKQVSFLEVTGASLVVTGRGDSNAGDSCATAGFQVACSKGFVNGTLNSSFVVTSGSAWDAYGSPDPMDDLHRSGGGQWWDAPCTSTSATFALDDFPSLPKIWASGYKYASFRWTANNVVSCSFSMRSIVNSVFYGGRDITQWVTGDLSQSSVTKQFEFSLLPKASLVISGQDDDGSGDPCVDGGFQISCSNGLASSSEWQVLGSEQAVDSSHQAGLGLGWSYSPCVSTSGTALTSDLTSSKIWANSAQPQKYVAFRWTPAEVLTCSFTASNVVDSVYYNGVDITSTVSGDKSSWSSGKQVSFTRVRGASLVIAAHDTDAGADSCITGSFQIRCSSGISSAIDWEVYGSSSSIDSWHRMGGGLGWSSTACSPSSSDVLPSAPWLPQIWASPDKYAAFRWKDQDYWELALKSEWDDSTFHHSAGLWSDSSTTLFGTGAAHENTLTEVFTSLEVTRVKLVMDEYSAIITMPKGMSGALQDRYSLQKLASARSSLLVVALTQFVPATTPSSMQDVPQGILSGPSPGWSSKSIVDAFGLLATDPVSPEQRYCGTGFDMQMPSGDMVGARIGTILGEFADCDSSTGVEGIGLETKSTYLGSGTIDRLGQKKFSRATVYVHNQDLPFLTCTFTMDSVFESLYYNGVNMTHLVSGDFISSSSTKQVSFLEVTGASLVVTGRGDSNAGDSCATAGFQIACSKGFVNGTLNSSFVVTSGSAWDAYGSPDPMDDLHRSGRGQWWDAPCTSTSATFALDDFPSLPKIWASGYKYASFRWNPDNVVTCRFTMRSLVDSVFYGGRDITQWVTGNLSSENSIKQFEFSQLPPHAWLAISGQDDGPGDPCVDGGFQISCSNGLSSSSNWQVLGSAQAVDSSHSAGLGLGWSSSSCVAASGAAQLSVPSLWPNSRQQFAAFRWAPAEVVSCSFTASHTVESVYYNGVDITLQVTGDLQDFNSTKQVSFSRVQGAYLAVTALGASGGTCATSSFQVLCSNGASSSSGWEVFGSTGSVDSSRQSGSGAGWGPPCTSSLADLWPKSSLQRKLWKNGAARATFRWLDYEFWNLALKAEWEDGVFGYSAPVWSDATRSSFGTGAPLDNTKTEAFTQIKARRVKV